MVEKEEKDQLTLMPDTKEPPAFNWITGILLVILIEFIFISIYKPI